MGVIDEYIKQGGLSGYANKILELELSKALNEKDHPFRLAINAFNGGDKQKATEIILTALEKANKGSPLNVIYVSMFLIPANKEMLKYAIDNYEDDELTKDLPQRIIKWASGAFYTRETKAAAGRKKGKINRDLAIAAWESYPNKKLGATAFSKFYFVKLGGKYDENGDKASKIPAERVIAKWIRDHENKKKNITLF